MSPAVSPAVVRPRVSADLPVLVEMLGAQQAGSAYPMRWPLPFPVQDFLVRSYEEQAWVAEVDGAVVGHVMVGRVEDPAIAAAFAPETAASSLATVSVLFVAEATRGTGVGGLLMDTAVAYARERGRLPVLDVVSSHAAVDVYRHRGWHEVARIRPAWLPTGRTEVILMSLPPAPS